MAQFLGEVQGSRGAVHRLGGKDSGMDTRCNGWNCGITVYAHTVDDVDIFEVYRTGGSDGGRDRKLIATIRSDEDEATRLRNE